MRTRTQPTVRYYPCPTCGIEVETDRPESVAGVTLPPVECPDCQETTELEELSALAAQRETVEAKISAQVRRARAAGASWTTVGTALGVSKQAAQQRYRTEDAR